MSLLPIVTYEDKVLRKKASPVEENTEEIQELIDDMFDTMYNANGVGLAAPQVGRPLRIFVADADAYAEKQGIEEEHGPIVMINPSIHFESNETTVIEEGCLSIPDIRGPVDRAVEIAVTFKDRNFTQQTMQVDDPLARVIQHETDHLNGVLFIDHLSYFKRKLLAAKLKNLASGDKDTDYPVVPKTA
jgi:peptide deformylase